MEYNEIVTATLDRALRAKSIATAFHHQISKWSLEQAILNRISCSMEEAAEDWLVGVITKAFQTTDRSEAVLFMENWKI